MEPMPLWEAAKKEMESDQFSATAESQPTGDIPAEIAINVAVAARLEASEGSSPNPSTSLENYVDEASKVIEAGACGVPLDFTFVTDNKERRLDRDLLPVEAYNAVLEPLRARFGCRFIANLNVLHGSTFEECMSPACAGLAKVAPCAPGHPEAFRVPAIKTLEETGVKPELAIHSTGEIELAKRRLIDTGILKKPYNWTFL